MSHKTIAAHGGDFTISHLMTIEELSSGNMVDADGLVNGVGFFSKTKGGLAIDATMSKTLAARSGDANLYFGTLDGKDVETHLVPLIGGPVWECKRFGASETDVDFEKWTQYLVVAYR